MNEHRTLVEALVDRAPPTLAPRLELVRDLEQQVIEQLRRCRAAWPSVELPAAVFVPYLAARLTDWSERPFDGLHVPDLYIACACSRSDPRALAAFESRFLPHVQTTLGRLRATAEQKSEVRQALWVQLFAGAAGSGPTITAYSGRGPLVGWIGIAAARAGRRLIQRDLRAGIEKEALLAALPAPDDGPELALLKTQCAGEIEEILRATLGSLDCRARTVLRLYYVDELSADDIAGRFRVHRATVARWIARATHSVSASTRRALVKKLQLPPEELGAIRPLVGSRLGASLSQIWPPEEVLEAPVTGGPPPGPVR